MSWGGGKMSAWRNNRFLGSSPDEQLACGKLNGCSWLPPLCLCVGSCLSRVRWVSLKTSWQRNFTNCLLEIQGNYINQQACG